jgi:hypothetical protein
LAGHEFACHLTHTVRPPNALYSADKPVRQTGFGAAVALSPNQGSNELAGSSPQRRKQLAPPAGPAPSGACRNTRFSMIILDHGTRSSRAASTSKAY